MFYGITAIILGIILIYQAFILWKSKDSNIQLVLCIICGLGFIGSGVTFFVIPKDLEYVSILLLLFFCVVYVVVYFILKQKQKRPRQTK